MPCCRCNGKYARCINCSCARNGKICVDCYPGRQGKCTNPFTKSSQAQSQPPASRPSQPSSPESLPPTPCSEPLPPSPSPEFLNSQQRGLPNGYARPHRPPTARAAHVPREAMTCSPPPLTNRRQPHFDSPSTSATLQPPTLPSLPNPRQLHLSLTPLSQQLPPETAVNASCTSTTTRQTIELPSPPSQEIMEDHSHTSHQDQLTNTTINTRTSGPHRGRNPCIVEGCHHLVAPNMWRSHMTLHAQGVFGGEIPSAWLLEQNSYICQQCLQIVSVSRQSSHSRKCKANPQHPPPVQSNLSFSSSNSNQSLPSFDEVCQLNHPTLRFSHPIQSSTCFRQSSVFHPEGYFTGQQ